MNYNDNFPSNSNVSKGLAPQQSEQKKQIQPVVQGKIKKKTFWENFCDLAKEGLSNAYRDILVPSLQKTASSMINNVTDIMIYGQAQPRNDNGYYRNNSYQTASYQSYYNRGGYSNNYGGRPQPQQPRSYSYDNIVLNTRADAERVLADMDDIIRQYGFTKVADLYELVGLQSNIRFTDNNYGWNDLRSANVVAVPDGYLLQLPKPMAID